MQDEKGETSAGSLIETDAVVIDYASVDAIHTDQAQEILAYGAQPTRWALHIHLRNSDSVPLAMPWIELTLTDAQDQPVLRRVLLPTDMAAPAELPARGEWSTSVSVIVTTGGARVAGYRLLAFYP